jgi:hypothetical protein
MPLDLNYEVLKDRILNLRERYDQKVNESWASYVVSHEKRYAQIGFLEKHLAILEKMKSQKNSYATTYQCEILAAAYGDVISEIKASYRKGRLNNDPWTCTLYPILVEDLVGVSGSNLRKEARLSGLELENQANYLQEFIKIYSPFYEVLFARVIPDVLVDLRRKQALIANPQQEEDDKATSTQTALLALSAR